MTPVLVRPFDIVIQRTGEDFVLWQVAPKIGIKGIFSERFASRLLTSQRRSEVERHAKVQVASRPGSLVYMTSRAGNLHPLA